MNPRIRIFVLLSEFEVSKSSFYRRARSQQRDFEDYQLIKKYFDKSKGRSGIRQLKMIIERSEGLVLNHKKIARIKKKYGLETRIRRKNKYRKFAKMKQEHETCANLVDRNFRDLLPDQVYSTDITTLKYANKKAYVAAVKDLGTKEIVGFNVSNRIDIELSNSAMTRALKKLDTQTKEGLIVHSDQGFHFTHFSFRNQLEQEGITQSMSRKGNCIDNAPIESFFGLLKDHLELKDCKNIIDVKKEVTRKINYYNTERPQIGLKKMPPSEYRRHLLGPF
jgi:putative transposase